MIDRLRHDWLAWILTLGAIAALTGPISLLSDLGRPFGGYITFHRAASATDEVDGNTPSWWSGISGNRLQHGDHLLLIDGQSHAEEAAATYRRAIADNSKTVQLLAASEEGPTQQVEVPVRIFTPWDFLDVRLPDLVTGLVLWLAAVIVYLARPDQPANRAFALASAVAGYGRCLYVHTLFFDTTFAILNELQLQAWLSLLGPVLFLLAIRFPKPSASRFAHRLLMVMTALGIIAYGCAVYSRIERFPISTRMSAGDIAYYLTILLLYVGVAALIARLVNLFIHSRSSKRDRRIATILIFGWILTLPPIVASGMNALQLPGGNSYYFLHGLDIRYMFLFAPLAFAFVLVRYHALQAPSPLFIFLMVFTTSAIAAALVAWLWTLGHQADATVGVGPPFFSLLVATLAIGLFWTFIAKIPRVLGRTLAWDRYSNASAREFGRRVSENIDLSHTPETIAQAVVDEFELKQCTLWLTTPDGTEMRLAAHAGERLTPLTEIVPLTGKRLANISYPFRPPAASTEQQPWEVNSPEAQGIEVVIPLALENRVLGVMGLGPRWDEDIFDSRNLDIFEIVGQQATLLLNVTQNVQELQRVPGRLVDVQERERLRLAQELHDTVQQFLGRLPFYLAVSRNSFESDPQTAIDLINRSIADVEEAAQAVRQIRHNLAPSQLDRGLAQALSTLIASFQRRTGINTSLTFDPELDAATNLETRHVIYRVVQQSLNNVDSHAMATRVSVQLTINDDQVCFAVVDNGRGSSEDERQAAKARGSFGMESMTARLAASGGGLSVLSSPGYGLEIKGWVPVAATSQAILNDPADGNGSVAGLDLFASGG